VTEQNQPSSHITGTLELETGRLIITNVFITLSVFSAE